MKKKINYTIVIHWLTYPHINNDNYNMECHSKQPLKINEYKMIKILPLKVSSISCSFNNSKSFTIVLFCN